jgi:hypothetical protein
MSTHGRDFGDDVLDPCLAQFVEAIDAAVAAGDQGNRSQSYIELQKRLLKDMTYRSIPHIEAIKRLNDEKLRPSAPTYPDTAIPLEEFEPRQDAILDDFFNRADKCAAVEEAERVAKKRWHQNLKATLLWFIAQRGISGCSDACARMVDTLTPTAHQTLKKVRAWFPYGIHYEPQPHVILASDTGGGKSRGAMRKALRHGIRKALQRGILNEFRIIWIVFSEDAANAAVKTFNDLRDELAAEIGYVSVPDAVIIRGIEKECKIGGELGAAAVALAENGGSVGFACSFCKLRDECAVPKRGREIGAGLKIYMHAHISTAMPGIPKTWAREELQIDEGGVPVYAFIIDEDFLDALMRENTLTWSDIPPKSDVPRLIKMLDGEPPRRNTAKKRKSPNPRRAKIERSLFWDWVYDNLAREFGVDDEAGADLASKRDWRVRTLIDAVQTADKAIECESSNGRISREIFSEWHVDIWDKNEERYRGRLDVLCDNILMPLIWRHRRTANFEVHYALKEGRKVDTAELFRPANQLSALYDLFDLVRSAARGERQEVYGVKSEVSEGEPTIRLGWLRRLPNYLWRKPLLVLDATAHDTISRLPFAARVDGMEFDASDPDSFFYVELHRIKIKNSVYTTQMKVIDAKPGVGSFNAIATEVVENEDGKRERVLKTKKDAKGKKCVPRLRRDARWSELLRTPFAINGRAIAQGKLAGFNSHKLVVDYAKRTSTLQDANICNWPGLLRGSNKQKDVSVQTNTGSLILKTHDLEWEAEKIFAMDPKARTVLRDVVPTKKLRYLRGKGDIGIPVETWEHPCEQVRMVFEAKTIAEEAQINGRPRGIRRPKDKPLLNISTNNVVDDATYDIVVTQAAVTLDVPGAALHALGAISLKPEHFAKQVPELVSNKQDAKEVLRHLVSDEREWEHITRFKFTGDTVRLGDPAAHPFLMPVNPFRTTYKPAGRKRRAACIIDQNRPFEEQVAGLERNGRQLVELDGKPVAQADTPARVLSMTKNAVRKRAKRREQSACHENQPPMQKEGEALKEGTSHYRDNTPSCNDGREFRDIPRRRGCPRLKDNPLTPTERKQRSRQAAKLAAYPDYLNGAAITVHAPAVTEAAQDKAANGAANGSRKKPRTDKRQQDKTRVPTAAGQNSYQAANDGE